MRTLDEDVDALSPNILPLYTSGILGTSLSPALGGSSLGAHASTSHGQRLQAPQGFGPSAGPGPSGGAGSHSTNPAPIPSPKYVHWCADRAPSAGESLYTSIEISDANSGRFFYLLRASYWKMRGNYLARCQTFKSCHRIRFHKVNSSIPLHLSLGSRSDACAVHTPVSGTRLCPNPGAGLADRES